MALSHVVICVVALRIVATRIRDLQGKSTCVGDRIVTSQYDVTRHSFMQRTQWTTTLSIWNASFFIHLALYL